MAHVQKLCEGSAKIVLPAELQASYGFFLNRWDLCSIMSAHPITYRAVNRLVLGDCEMIFNRDVQQELCNQASGTFDDLSHVFSWIRMPDDNELTLVSHADKAGLSKYVVKR